MNDAPTSDSAGSTIPDTMQLAKLQEEATATATTSDPDLRERVCALTARALDERRLALGEVASVAGAIMSGVASGLGARGGEIREGLRQAVAGLDEAVGSAAQAASYTLSEAVAQGRAFKDNELKANLEQLRDLEGMMVDALKRTASQSGGKLKEELGYLSDHLRHSGTRTGAQVRDALQRLASGVRATGNAGRAGLSESAAVATDHLAQVASGVLAALSESLKRRSERLRS